MAYDLELAGDDFEGDDFAGADEFAGDDFAGDDVTGEEAIVGAAEDLMGARGRRLARKFINRAKAKAGVSRSPGRPSGGSMRGLPTKRPSLYSATPGVPAPAVGRVQLGFDIMTCDATTNSSGGSLTARPQVPWRGTKLIISISGANNGNYAVTVRPTIGNRPLLAGSAATDARSYPATALGNELICDGVGPGIDVTLQFVVTPAVSGTDVVAIAPTWIGDATI